MQVMIFGAGYSGQAIGAETLARGKAACGTTRGPDKLAELGSRGITPYIYSGENFAPELHRAMRTITHLVQSIPPGAEGDSVLRLTGRDLKKWFPALTWVGYLSTVGVYGNHDGAWVDETTPCHPKSARALERVAAERAWQEAGQAAGIPVAILRLAGIYGPGRNAFVNLARGTAHRIIKKDQVFNRIRVEDIAAATLFLASSKTGGIFNITDDEPAPPQDVVTEAARLMGVDPPPEQAFETAEMRPMARSFYGDNKRIYNTAICNLGFQFQHRDYRTSLADLWSSGRWKG
ncbi:NAD-dependent epimerase/dehydratase family protein [Rhizobiales bacterium RZME27]|jgi:nucleoside-diphosphate-sugar epimerase|uniref:NAD-dependent epimerase/dehydratase family protein n=1 Tax=Endobacterium cereale TaxID=2663029 RepID=A0A6A8A4S3_9HYPH|nr:SDR family oxidoreductase [Endobacterium cereale]MEB2844883.1 SDR family oxidoreductase [Endobacterium cereale]MQY44797.1 NAD-dependent epimerase/dehydratase family protein [Endobacterium cereale]